MWLFLRTRRPCGGDARPIMPCGAFCSVPSARLWCCLQKPTGQLVPQRYLCLQEYYPPTWRWREQDESRRERNELKKKVRAEVVARWQEHWRSSTNGRELYSFFPDVEARLQYVWVEPDYVVSQILTGHGNFRSRLHAMSLNDTPICYCERARETRDHVLWECELYAEERDEMLQDWSRKEIGPVFHHEMVSSKDGFARLRAFAHKWHRKRKELEL